MIETTNNSLSNSIDVLAHKFIFNDQKFEKCHKELTNRKSQINASYVSLGIGKYDKNTGKIIEICGYKYFDMKLFRITTEPIPKDMFNHLASIETDCNRKLKQILAINQEIQTKRKEDEYSTQLTKSKNEEFRHKRHQKKLKNPI